MMAGKKILYGFGNLSAAVSYQALVFYGYYFYVEVNKFPKIGFTLAWVLFSIWNALNDPLLGQWSDRTKTRWGRRIPFIALGMIPYALFFYLLWVPPFSLWSTRGIFLYLLVSLLLFDTLFTLVIINWTALFPEMFPTLEERATVSAWRQLFGVAGLALGMALPPLLYVRYGWQAMGAVLGAVTLAATFLSLLGCRETPGAGEAGVSLAAAIRYTFTSKAALMFLLANFGNYVAIGALEMAFPFFAKHILRIPDQYLTYLLVTSFAVAVLTLPFWRAWTVRRGPRAAQILCAAAFGLASLGFMIVRGVVPAYVLCGLLGVGLSGVIMVPDILLADVADEDEIRSGRRREGMFFGVNGTAIRLAGAAHGLVVTAVFIVFGYNEKAAVQTASALLGIRFLAGFVPFLAMILVILAMRIYPLHGARLAEIKAALVKKRAPTGT